MRSSATRAKIKWRAQQLARVLESRGWSIWWDRDISPGAAFDRSIERELESARCVIVLWSKASVDSDWVRGEAAEGKRRGVLVPALVGPARPPLEFRSIQFADLTDWNGEPHHAGLRDLVDAVAGIHGNPPPESEQVSVDHLSRQARVILVVVALLAVVGIGYAISTQVTWFGASADSSDSQLERTIADGIANVDRLMKMDDPILALQQAQTLHEQFPSRSETRSAFGRAVEAEARNVFMQNGWVSMTERLQAHNEASPWLDNNGITMGIAIRIAHEEGQRAIGEERWSQAWDFYRVAVEMASEDTELTELISAVVQELHAVPEPARESNSSRGYSDFHVALAVAARAVAAGRSGPLEPSISAALVACLERDWGNDEFVRTLAVPLAARAPNTLNLVRGWLDYESWNDDSQWTAVDEKRRSQLRGRRRSAYLYMEAADEITPELELQYHLGNILTLDDIHFAAVEAQGYFATGRDLDDWLALKDRAGIAPITFAPILEENRPHEIACRILAEQFFQEVEPSLTRWEREGNAPLRKCVAIILRIADRPPSLQLHLSILDELDIQFTRHKAYFEAMQYLTDLQGREARDEVVAALRKLAARVDGWLDENNSADKDPLNARLRVRFTQVETYLALAQNGRSTEDCDVALDVLETGLAKFSHDERWVGLTHVNLAVVYCVRMNSHQGDEAEREQDIQSALIHVQRALEMGMAEEVRKEIGLDELRKDPRYEQVRREVRGH